MGNGNRQELTPPRGGGPVPPISPLTERDRGPGGGISQTPLSPPRVSQRTRSRCEGDNGQRAPRSPAAGRGGRLPEVLPIVLVAACPQLRVVVGCGRRGRRRRRRKRSSRTEPGRRGAERTGSPHRRRHLRCLLPTPPPPRHTERAAAPRQLTGTRMLGGRGAGPGAGTRGGSGWGPVRQRFPSDAPSEDVERVSPQPKPGGTGDPTDLSSLYQPPQERRGCERESECLSFGLSPVLVAGPPR